MQLVNHPIDDPAAWRGADMAVRTDWLVELADGHRAELVRAVDEVEQRSLGVFDVRKADFPLPVLGPMLESLRYDLEGGRGFLCLRGLPVGEWTEHQARIAFWGMGSYLGWAEPQDGAGSRLHDVKDIGRSFGADDTIRYFQTNHAIEFHNDGADMFALFCLRAGRRGGRSRLVSAVEVFNEIARRRPDLVVTLQEDFHVDARGQRADGSKCQVHPVFTMTGSYLSILLKRAYIESAQRFDDVPRLSSTQREALDMLGEVMEEPGMALEFDLAAGDVLMASNHTVLHGRTAFEDAPGEAGRHMLRLWLTLPNGRPLPPHYANTREFFATYNRRAAG